MEGKSEFDSDLVCARGDWEGEGEIWAMRERELRDGGIGGNVMVGKQSTITFTFRTVKKEIPNCQWVHRIARMWRSICRRRQWPGVSVCGVFVSDKRETDRSPSAGRGRHRRGDAGGTLGRV